MTKLQRPTKRYKPFGGPFYMTLEKKAYSLYLRSNPTPEEEILWRRLQGRQIKNNTFTRQKVILGFIADFYSAYSRVVVEVDGNQHDKEYDKKRDRAFNKVGIYVLRFSNTEVREHIEEVIQRITEVCKLKP